MSPRTLPCLLLVLGVGLSACTRSAEPAATTDAATPDGTPALDATSATDSAAMPPIDIDLSAADSSIPEAAPMTTPLPPPALVGSVELKRLLDAEGRAALHIGFLPDTNTLGPDGTALVGEVARMLANDPAMRLIVEAHTDASGGAGPARELSQQQAEAVVAALVARGIASSRLTAVGHGADNPLVPPTDEAGKARNRRVELLKKSPRAP